MHLFYLMKTRENRVREIIKIDGKPWTGDVPDSARPTRPPSLASLCFSLSLMTPRRECGDIFSVYVVGLRDMLAIVCRRCWVRRRPCVDAVAGNRRLRKSPKPMLPLPPELMPKRGAAAVDLPSTLPSSRGGRMMGYRINLCQDDMAGCNLVAVVGASVAVVEFASPPS